MEIMTMNKKGKLYLGKCDGYGSGRKSCEAYLTYELTEDGRFSAQGEIWNSSKTDIIQGGQCVDSVRKFFPLNQKARRIEAIWKRWHLNDMKAGTPEQEDAIKAWKAQGNKYDYTKAVEHLKSIGLYEVNGYKYGTAWLKEELPQAIIDEVLSW